MIFIPHLRSKILVNFYKNKKLTLKHALKKYMYICIDFDKKYLWVSETHFNAIKRNTFNRFIFLKFYRKFFFQKILTIDVTNQILLISFELFSGIKYSFSQRIFYLYLIPILALYKHKNSITTLIKATTQKKKHLCNITIRTDKKFIFMLHDWSRQLTRLL